MTEQKITSTEAHELTFRYGDSVVSIDLRVEDGILHVSVGGTGGPVDVVVTEPDVYVEIRDDGTDGHVWAGGDIVLGPACEECGKAMPNSDSDYCEDCDEEYGPISE